MCIIELAPSLSAAFNFKSSLCSLKFGCVLLVTQVLPPVLYIIQQICAAGYQRPTLFFIRSSFLRETFFVNNYGVTPLIRIPRSQHMIS